MAAPALGRIVVGRLADFDRLREDLIAVTRQSDGLPLHRVKMPSPFNERVRYNLYSALTITAIHEHRHLLQAERAAAPGAP